MQGELSFLQAGFTVSTRNFKKAVHRNRIKRLLREAYRMQKNTLLSALQEKHKALALFFIYTGTELPTFQQIFDQTGKVLRRLQEGLAD